MSEISDAFDALKTRIIAVLPSEYKQLSNPYFVEQNHHNVLNLGWGIALGPGENSERNLSCKLSIKRQIIIPLTTIRRATELNKTAKESAEKSLMEDQMLIIRDFEKNVTLGNSIANVKYLSDSGVVNVFANKDTHVKLETVLEIEYFENL